MTATAASRQAAGLVVSDRFFSAQRAWTLIQAVLGWMSLFRSSTKHSHAGIQPDPQKTARTALQVLPVGSPAERGRPRANSLDPPVSADEGAVRRWRAHDLVDELSYAPLAARVQMSAHAAQSKLRQGLATEGFHTITHKVSVNGSGLDSCYLLVGCNPRLTRLALATCQHVGSATPITVVVFGDGAWSTLEAFDPMIMTDLVGNRALLAIFIDARFRIERVLASLAAQAAVIPLKPTATDSASREESIDGRSRD